MVEEVRAQYMKHFRMSIRFNKQSPQDFGLTDQQGRFICEQDGSQWVSRQLYDFGWGKENGFYKIPLGNFEQLMELVQGKDKEDAYGAAAVIIEEYPTELKRYLLDLMQHEVRFWNRKRYRVLNRIFALHRGVNLTFQEGMPISTVEAEHRQWKEIAKFYSSK